jgi:peptidoglycan/LPS O-acetylase OafA/YrhL
MLSKKILSLIVIVLFVFTASAQPGGGGPPGGGEPVPITGIELLIAAGALLGGRKFLQNKLSKRP